MSLKDSLFAKYIKDRQGLDLLDEGYGFVTYKITGDECFISDMAIDKDLKGKGWGRRLLAKLEEIAKKSSCKFISANVHLFDDGASNTLIAALKTGFQVKDAHNKALLIVKNITEDSNG